MEKRGRMAMSNQMLATVDKVRGGFQLDSHINVTQLSRSTAWRDSLKKFGAMQILDRNQTAAVLLTPETFRAIMQYMEAMEEDLQSREIEILLEARKERNDWETGEELSRKAKESFFSRQEQLRGLLDGNQE